MRTRGLRANGTNPRALGTNPKAKRSHPKLTPVEVLRELSYAQYLRSRWWKSRREVALRMAGEQCQRCGAGKELVVHHLSYERLGAELPQDLEVLCWSCHEVTHEIAAEAA